MLTVWFMVMFLILDSKSFQDGVPTPCTSPLASPLNIHTWTYNNWPQDVKFGTRTCEWTLFRWRRCEINYLSVYLLWNCKWTRLILVRKIFQRQQYSMGYSCLSSVLSNSRPTAWNLPYLFWEPVFFNFFLALIISSCRFFLDIFFMRLLVFLLFLKKRHFNQHRSI